MEETESRHGCQLPDRRTLTAILCPGLPLLSGLVHVLLVRRCGRCSPARRLLIRCLSVRVSVTVPDFDFGQRSCRLFLLTVCHFFRRTLHHAPSFEPGVSPPPQRTQSSGVPLLMNRMPKLFHNCKVECVLVWALERQHDPKSRSSDSL